VVSKQLGTSKSPIWTGVKRYSGEKRRQSDRKGVGTVLGVILDLIAFDALNSDETSDVWRKKSNQSDKKTP